MTISPEQLQTIMIFCGLSFASASCKHVLSLYFCNSVYPLTCTFQLGPGCEELLCQAVGQLKEIFQTLVGYKQI